MVRAVASRVIPRYRITKKMAKQAAEESARVAEVAVVAEVPETVRNVPTRVGEYTNLSLERDRPANASIRPMGNSRRVFLLDPHLEAEDMEGLAHRIRALSKSEAINSVLVATDDQADYGSRDGSNSSNSSSNKSNNNVLPRYLTQRREIKYSGLELDTDPAPDHTWYVAGGYDPATALDPDDQARTDYLLDAVRKLATACRGRDTKIPLISVAHGAVTDGGYALCMGSYNVATDESTLRILNPSRGLSLDPIGYSYLLPRLGRDFGQDSRRFSGCGMILALSGYEADASDLIETGLATHWVAGGSGFLPILEQELATLPPWNQQGLVRKPRRYYGQQTYMDDDSSGGSRQQRQQQNYLQRQLQQQNQHRSGGGDPNGMFRNKSIANLMAQVADVCADSTNEFPLDYFGSIYEEGVDQPHLDTEHFPWEEGFYSSQLVEMAAKLDAVFRQENSLEGLMERLREVAASGSDDGSSGDSSEDEAPALAADLLAGMERQSPLSLRVVYQLMKMGSSPKATMENCVARETKAQRKLVREPDFRNWLAHVRKHGSEAEAPAFGGWKHASIKEVTADEVDRLIS